MKLLKLDLQPKNFFRIKAASTHSRVFRPKEFFELRPQQNTRGCLGPKNFSNQGRSKSPVWAEKPVEAKKGPRGRRRWWYVRGERVCRRSAGGGGMFEVDVSAGSLPEVYQVREREVSRRSEVYQVREREVSRKSAGSVPSSRARGLPEVGSVPSSRARGQPEVGRMCTKFESQRLLPTREEKY